MMYTIALLLFTIFNLLHAATVPLVLDGALDA
jgi:hypothetical protein